MELNYIQVPSDIVAIFCPGLFRLEALHVPLSCHFCNSTGGFYPEYCVDVVIAQCSNETVTRREQGETIMYRSSRSSELMWSPRPVLVVARDTVCRHPASEDNLLAMSFDFGWVGVRIANKTLLVLHPKIQVMFLLRDSTLRTWNRWCRRVCI